MIKLLSGFLAFVLLIGAGVLVASDLQELKEGEYGVVFSVMPTFLGGGVSSSFLQPGEKEYILPWEKLYKVDTTLQSITWGGIGTGDNKAIEDYVETRSIDGNEVGLAMTVQYSVDPQMVRHIITSVAPNDLRLREIVTTIARGDIRTHMNALDTRDFFDSKLRNIAVEKVKMVLNHRLKPEGIIINDVIFHDYRFERRLANGEIDRSYQEQIDEEQSNRQKVKQEQQKIEVVNQQKLSELEQARAKSNQLIEAAKGEKRQAEYRGEQYLVAKRIEAERVTKVGENEIAALRKQIEALEGPGGRALLKVEIVKHLIKANPRFMLVNSVSRGSNVGVNRTDTNELLKQIGLFAVAKEGVDSKEKSALPDNSSAKSPIDAGKK